MRRLLSVLGAAALTAAMLVVLPGPAMAQSFRFDFDHNNDFFDHNNDFFNGFGSIDQQTDETGNVDLNSEIVNTGNNSNQCAAPLQFGNTGNLQNAQEFGQFNSFADDIDFDGSSFLFAPDQNVNCNQAVRQASTASG